MLTEVINSPPSLWYSRKPVITLQPIPRLNNGTGQFEDSLDRHVNDVLESPSKLQRTMMGVWSFLKTRKACVVCNALILTIGSALGVRLVPMVQNAFNFIETSDIDRHLWIFGW